MMDYVFGLGAVFFFAGCEVAFGNAGGAAAFGLSMMLLSIKWSVDHKLDMIWRRVWRQS